MIKGKIEAKKIIYIFWTLILFTVYGLMNPIPFKTFFFPLFLWFLIFLSATGLGRVLLGILNIKPEPILEDISVSAALGLGIYYLLTLIIAALGLLGCVAVFLIIIAACLISYKEIYELTVKAYEKCTSFFCGGLSLTEISLLMVIFTALALAFINSFSLPIHDYPLSASLSTARRYLLEGGLVNISFNYISDLPQGMTMLYAMARALGGSSLPGLMTFSFFFLMLISVYAVSRKISNRTAALFAFGAAATTPVLYRFLMIDHLFVASAFYSFMAFYCFQRWGRGFDLRWLVISGLFCGFSLSFGLFTLFTPFILLLMIYVTFVRGKKSIDFHEHIDTLSAFLIPFVLVLLPVILKNFFHTGYFLFPFVTGHSPHTLQLGLETAKSAWGYMFPLWHIPFEDKISIYNFFMLGPLYFLIIPCFVFFKRYERPVKEVVFYIVLYLGIYTVAGRKTPFLFSLIPFGAVFSVSLMKSFSQGKKYFPVFLYTSLGVVLLVNIHMILPDALDSERINYVFGYEEKNEYLNRIEGMEVFSFINNEIPVESRVFVVGENRTYYIDRKTLSPGLLTKEPVEYYIRRFASPRGVINKLKNEGFSYMLINRRSAEEYVGFRSESILRVFEGILEKCDEIYRNGGYSVYEL